MRGTIGIEHCSEAEKVKLKFRWVPW